MKKTKHPKIPSWIGNYPFPPDQKKPILIRKGDQISQIYGEGNHLDTTPIYVSTDKILLGEYTVPPGQFFDPPDIHAGDECYYCLEGVATIFDPVHGDVVQMTPGSALLIPKGTWHQGFNFGDKNFRLIAVIAPKPWSDEMGTAIVFEGKSQFYKK